jgi:hypothetical protein
MILLRIGNKVTLENFANDSRMIGILESLVNGSGDQLIILLEQVFKRFV